MTLLQQETHTITCPFCWQSQEVFVDVSGGSQVYTEDCQVCCHPMKITVSVEPEPPASLQVEPE